MSRPQLEQVQLERLLDLLHFAGRHSPFHAARFEQAGFRPSAVSSVTDLRTLPTLEKHELISHNASVHSQVRLNRYFTAETSGTTGQALEFRKSEVWDSALRAHEVRCYGWYGVHPADRNGYFWGYDFGPSRARKVRVQDFLLNRVRLFRYERSAVIQFARQIQSATYLSGYSSMIYETARVFTELGLVAPELRMVKGTSEMILDAYQHASRRAFGRGITSEYGAAEAGLVAFECPMGSMHINVEDVVLEVQENGEALVTNLLSHSFPIIRYRIGDVVRVSERSCACGRAHPILEEVIGRRGASIIGREGRYPALTFYYVFKNLAIHDGTLLNYRARQDATGEVVLQIEGAPSADTEDKIAREVNKYFQGDVRVDVVFVDRLDRGKGKVQYFESSLPQ